MLKIVFNNGKETQASFRNVKDGVVELVGSKVNNMHGFMAYSLNGKLLGDYSAYKTKYNKYNPVSGGIQLSTGEVEPIPPEPPVPPTPPETVTVTFMSDEHCILHGDTQVIVPYGSDASELTLPELEVDMEYQFNGWNPEFSGQILSDSSFQATTILQEQYTVESRVTMLEECMMEIAEVVYA